MNTMRIIYQYFTQISDEITSIIAKTKNLLSISCKVLIVLSLSVISAYPIFFYNALISCLKASNYIVSFILVYSFGVFFLYPEIRKNYRINEIKEDELLFFWVSMNNFVDYIIKTKSFKLYEIKKEFAISHKIVWEMIRKIDETELFVRWKNNERILNWSLTKSDIIKLLSEEENEEEIYQTFTQTPLHSEEENEE